MHQIRSVWNGVVFPIWVTNGNICLFVKVSGILPEDEVVSLEELTEVVVTPPGSQSDVNNLAGNVSIEIVELLIKTENIENIESIKEISHTQSLRVLPFIALKERVFDQSWNTVFINPSQYGLDDKKYYIAQLKIILSPSQRRLKNLPDSKSSDQGDVVRSEQNYLSTFVLVRPQTSCPLHSIIICDSLRRQLGLAVSSRVYFKRTDHVEFSKRDSDSKSCIILFKKVLLLNYVNLRPVVPTEKQKELLASGIKKYLDKHHILVCSAGTLLNIGGDDFLVECENSTACHLLRESTFEVSEQSVCVGDPLIQPIKTTWGATLPLKTMSELDAKFYPLHLSKKLIFGGCHKLFNNLRSTTLSIIEQNQTQMKEYRGCLLLCGPKGSGKTTLLKKLTTELCVYPHFVYVHSVDCKQLRGKRVESLQKEFLYAVSEAYYRQPSVLILKDLDVLIPSPTRPEEEVGVEALYNFRVAKLLMTVVKSIENYKASLGKRLVLIATSTSKKSIHESLVTVKGNHFFNHVFELSRLDADEREDILLVLLNSNPNLKKSSIESLDISELVRRTDGYLPLDLNSLIERAIHSSCMRRSNEGAFNDLEINQEDFENTLKDFTPFSLRGVSLRQRSNTKLANVGGVSEIKATLLETVLWPSKFPLLYGKCPLRPQSCMLLFGAPGTGKTLLVEALANECNINFISVEGPELLSKYIGASEQAVRDLFARAKSAKPCILFFDEVDSIAPRRGQDSTGVTDRIVNQLLTQMDGVEGLEKGIFILAATSRPDLLDPALLRPGRFDKCLHCSLPNVAEITEILKILSNKMLLEDDVDLELIATRTEFFTGADLQAILYTAQLNALHEQLNDKRKNKLLAENSNRLESITKNGENIDVDNALTMDRGDSYSCDDCKEWTYDIAEHIERNVLQENEMPGEHRRVGSSFVGDGSDVYGSKAEKHCIVKIGERHLMESLNNAKPSVGASERRKYGAIYRAFVNNRGNDFLDAEQKMQTMKVTLA